MMYDDDYDAWDAARDEYEGRRDRWISERSRELWDAVYPVPVPRTDVVDAWEVYDAVMGADLGVMSGDVVDDEADRLRAEYAAHEFDEGED